jgi:hypothetical protein
MSLGAAITRWEHRYGLVLLMILCSLVFQLAAPDEAWAQTRPAVERLATMVVAIAVFGSAAALIGFGELGAGGRIVTALLVALAPLAILRGVVLGVRQQGAVTLHTMFGVLCIYLLLGMLFSYAYALVGDAQSEPFFALGISADISDYLYFSFATLTTVGYGDLAAATDLGRSVAITEALIGQIYLVTVGAVIVGSLSRRRA